MSQPYDPPFRRSSFCGNGGCVEAAPLPHGRVAVRDSKDHTVPQHVYTMTEWAAFIRGVKAGEFDFTLPMDHDFHTPHS